MRTVLLAAALFLAQPLHAQEIVIVHAHNKSFFALKNEQVMHAFLMFKVVPPVERAQDRLQLLRDRDALLLPAGGVPSLRAGALGAAVLGGAIVLAAHAPAPLRPLFDGPVHAGPALFDGGGMGAGIGGRF